MGALGVGCGTYNYPPTDFSISEPSNNAQITIDDSNINTGSITFSWGESSDQNGDSLYYLMRATSAEIGNHDIDTSATSFSVSYADMIEDMTENNVTVATIEWTVHVTDGIDTVEANNAPFSITIDGGWAMNASAEALIPEVFALHQNYPNPFNPTTTLSFSVPTEGVMSLNIYDMTGRLVSTLVDGNLNQGYHSITWNGMDRNGHAVSSGMYIYSLNSEGASITKKMVMMK